MKSRKRVRSAKRRYWKYERIVWARARTDTWAWIRDRIAWKLALVFAALAVGSVTGRSVVGGFLFALAVLVLAGLLVFAYFRVVAPSRLATGQALTIQEERDDRETAEREAEQLRDQRDGLRSIYADFRKDRSKRDRLATRCKQLEAQTAQLEAALATRVQRARAELLQWASAFRKRNRRGASADHDDVMRIVGITKGVIEIALGDYPAQEFAVFCKKVVGHPLTAIEEHPDGTKVVRHFVHCQPLGKIADELSRMADNVTEDSLAPGFDGRFSEGDEC